ncbi:hypothetical protein L249_4790 [Ophiocordyceps polyrhachis-furcata BCC 54312]|uniref:DUF4419 domain-containing protein n=1 Tax=Ophiocordyceps polyrhachis-furcata BCC 54312 TaxID=1330021 RepID=A0A367L2J7_9HYPO|nr:hypothetical protein L249_4790 [Ophiocordyceps polyrhachis-furcata BCC 54312]
MPVTLNIVDHPAENWQLQKVSRRRLRENHISASENGFVWSAYRAYSKHHHLVIRPDDVWLAILTQLSFYIKANAEQVRALFVSHEGRKELEMVDTGSIVYCDFGAFAQNMTTLMSKNVNDPELRTWIMPSFSTTTDDDLVAASVLFMGAMHKYFSYKCTMVCGFPSVTLLGEVADWQDILERLDKLEQLGDEANQFASMLRPVLRRMILSFEQPSSTDVNCFWNTIISEVFQGSGMNYLTGWLSAFCFWDQSGKARSNFGQNAVLDDVCYPRINTNDVPGGFASVPVTVDDNGHVYDCTMIAGSVGMLARSPPSLHRRGAGGDTGRGFRSVYGAHSRPAGDSVVDV